MNFMESLQRIGSPAARLAILQVLQNEFNGLGNKLFSSAALAIKAGGSTLVKTGTLAYGLAQGRLFNIAANTDMPALVGTVPNGQFATFQFFRDSVSGTVTSAMGTPATTLANAMPINWPLKKVPIGFIIVNPTGTGAFVGGTTALDDATVVPNVQYINSLGVYDPTAILP